MTLPVFPISHGRDSSGFWRNAWALIHPYWHSEQWLKAWALLLSVLALSFGNVGLSVAYNLWHRNIYEALETRNANEFGHLLLVFVGIAALTILMSAYSKYLTKILIMRWRRWLLYGYFDTWVTDSRHYAMQLQRPVDNPDQRLTQDIEAFTRLTLETLLGLVYTLTSLASFSVILWTVSGSLQLLGLTIPGYMFWAALIYSGIGSLLTHLIGRRLIALNNQQQRVEADVRFDLVRLRENAETIALQRGEGTEQAKLRQRFGQVWSNFHTLVRTEKNLAFFIAGYSQFSFVFPLAVAGPRLFSGTLQFGQLMQLNQAFGNLQSNLSWFIAVYHDLVQWRAVSDRLLGFDRALKDVMDAPQAIRITRGTRDRLEIRALQNRQPNGHALLRIDELHIPAGRHVLIQGPSGCGKSTLLRTLAGLWPYGSGDLRLPAQLYIVPQRPYFPEGTLRQALSYASTRQAPGDAQLCDALRACRLEHLQTQLDTEAHWEKRLSPGEQQRLAIARAVVAKPDWLLLDEVTSALSLADEERVYRFVRDALPGCTIISIGHRRSLSAYHDVLWQVTREATIEQRGLDRPANEN